MKEKILKLHIEGKSYREIEKILGCAKSTIAYHCSDGEKEKTKARIKKSRKKNPMLRKVQSYKESKVSKAKAKKALRNKVTKYQIRIPTGGYAVLSEATLKFGVKEVMLKIGDSPKCHLSGRIIDFDDPSSYQFDHNVPVSKGGKNSLENLEVACTAANQAKHNLTHKEFIELCKDILINQGYKILCAEGNDVDHS